MKAFILALILVSTQAFANEKICSVSETWEIFETVKAHKVSKNHGKFSFSEKQMIHLTISLQDWLKGVSKEEALETFADMYDGKIGSDAGEIKYFRIDGKEFALVHYWPGENEYGAIFELKRNNAFKLIAEVGDSFITCK